MTVSPWVLCDSTVKKKIIAEHLFLYTEGEAALQVNNFELRRL